MSDTSDLLVSQQLTSPWGRRCAKRASAAAVARAAIAAPRAAVAGTGTGASDAACAVSTGASTASSKTSAASAAASSSSTASAIAVAVNDAGAGGKIGREDAAVKSSGWGLKLAGVAVADQSVDEAQCETCRYRCSRTRSEDSAPRGGDGNQRIKRTVRRLHRRIDYLLGDIRRLRRRLRNMHRLRQRLQIIRSEQRYWRQHHWRQRQRWRENQMRGWRWEE
ncbi:uncharacterized protein LOC124778919 [Schistocerca piceifrons]|uniref:uncharacterized protein LOC124778919 n=1 Tax=Schistocerca piceifrons TaxID=274613 RepID=UPI001F5E6E13|nr:uncharacterized protein LOC124778919 [Schistocerca piceifrons]